MVALSAPRRYRVVLVGLLVVGLLAAFYVLVVRERKESQSRRVEIAMDYSDFNSVAQSYGYDQQSFLIALRRAGLTSLAVSEELGGNLGTSATAAAFSGQALLAQAELGRVLEPTLAALAKAHPLSADDVYVVVFDPNEVERYRTALVENLGYRAVRTLHVGATTVLMARTQLDYFGSLGLGLPQRPLAYARDLHLLLDPRVQNDERFDAPQIEAIFASFKRHERASTVIFFGQRNEVLGFPDHLADTIAAFKASHLNYGTIETYDKVQIQKGDESLATGVIGQTVRVQAIAKPELDKLSFETVVARYLLGVRERNVRVVYLRPFLHAQPGMSLEKTNVELVRRIATGLRARGFTLGRATPIPAFRINPVVVALVSLAVPAVWLLLFEAFGVRRARLAYWFVGIDLAIVLVGYLVHHDLAARKLLALLGAIGFATMAVVAIPRAFTLPAMRSYGACLLAGLRTLGIALAVSLGGALVVVGLLSTPLLMNEVARFTGVKAVIVVPPVLALALYLFTRRFGLSPLQPRDAALEPIRVYQLVAVAILGIAAVVYVARSGNSGDVTPTPFELALRSDLTSVLGVRPRFKEFFIGFPLMMLLPALRLDHKRAVGWLFAIGIAIGTADVVDTFSHLHTSLAVSLVRIVNGAIIGIVVGAIAIAVYRAIAMRAVAITTRRSQTA